MSTPTRAASVRPFGWRDKIGYMFGDFGNDFTFILQTVFFLAFYTDVMGIEAAHVGTLFLIARILDAFTDVGMGRIVDLLRPGRSGRFKPWILRIAIPVTLASAMMYMPFVVDADYGVRVAYMCVTYVIWGSIFYTAVNIPYGSMAAVITDDPKNRASLSVFRSVGAQLAYLLISAGLPLYIFSTDSTTGSRVMDPMRMAIAASVCAILGVICYILCYVNVEERIEAPAKVKGESASFFQMLGTLRRNRALLALIVGAIAFLVGMQVAGGATVYLWKDYFQRPDMMSVAQTVSIVPVFVMAVFAAQLAMRVGKKETIAISLFFSGIVAIAAWFMGIKDPLIFVVIFFFISLGQGMYNILVWAVITDVLDQQEVNTHERDDATIYAIYSWSRKLGQALAGWIVGVAVSAIGYSSEAAKSGAGQAPETIQGIYLLFLLVPGVLYLVTALVMWLWYPLGRKQVEDNRVILQQRHKADTADAPHASA
ncbi:MAG: glycoside-pentoside-hexuronide (GPH):cation symporter [Actinomycetaceae bacterium]|nr:glycoside-pentoside-hexuronide (GPH):cation symporter [Actinomycetaceae bacterium]